MYLSGPILVQSSFVAQLNRKLTTQRYDLINLLLKHLRQNRNMNFLQASMASEFAIIIAIMAIFQTIHSNNMSNSNSRHLPFVESIPTSKIALQNDQFKILRNQ
ncbi:hypothetical protein ACHAW6_010857 [Cyclotella cf. meneghiniana]